MFAESGDFTILLARAEEIARPMVTQDGMCPPFAVLIHKDDSIHTLTVDTKKALRFGDYLAALLNTLQSEPRRDVLRAVALCSTGYAMNPATGEQTRAVIVQLEDPSGSLNCVLIPYSRDLFGAVRFHEPIIQPSSAQIFERH